MGKWNTHAPHVPQHGCYQQTKQEALKVVLVKIKTAFTEWSLAVLLHVCATLDRFVWGSAEACILRTGGGKHFITEIRRLSEPSDSECRTCLPFTHRCRLSQSGVSGAALAALTANEV